MQSDPGLTPVITIRRARPDEFDEVLSLMDNLGLERDDLTPGTPGIFVAQLGPEIVGCAVLESDGTNGLIRGVGVANDRQRHGIGRRLMEFVLEHARELRLSTLYLLTTTAEDYFLRLGYERVDAGDPPDVVTRSPQYSICTAARAVLMKKNT